MHDVLVACEEVNAADVEEWRAGNRDTARSCGSSVPQAIETTSAVAADAQHMGGSNSSCSDPPTEITTQQGCNTIAAEFDTALVLDAAALNVLFAEVLNGIGGRSRFGLLDWRAWRGGPLVNRGGGKR